MRRVFPDEPEPTIDLDAARERMWQMLRDQTALKLMLLGMPPGSTLEDARFLHRKLKQADRTPCSFLDRELGIVRDR
jgi:hypothetical protein